MCEYECERDSECEETSDCKTVETIKVVSKVEKQTASVFVDSSAKKKGFTSPTLS